MSAYREPAARLELDPRPRFRIRFGWREVLWFAVYFSMSVTALEVMWPGSWLWPIGLVLGWLGGIVVGAWQAHRERVEVWKTAREMADHPERTWCVTPEGAKVALRADCRCGRCGEQGHFGSGPSGGGGSNEAFLAVIDLIRKMAKGRLRDAPAALLSGRADLKIDASRLIDEVRALQTEANDVDVGRWSDTAVDAQGGSNDAHVALLRLLKEKLEAKTKRPVPGNGRMGLG